MTFKINETARRVALAAAGAVVTAEVSESPLCGMGWSRMHQQGREPECGVALRMLLRSGEEVRVSVDVLPSPLPAGTAPPRPRGTRRADLYKRRRT